ncbi:MAG: response regulator transcription factor [Rhodobacteraceae bacterium]|nr:response regulator transcription factor [Paracoccaceae bacterium]
MPQPETALIVEDDPKVRRVLCNVLEEGGFCVIEAETAARTLELIVREAPALVTLDIQLGRENGLDLLRDIRKVSQVPVIMVTGRDDVIDRVVGLEIGADDYIVKPFHVREVLARVRAVLRRNAATGAVAGASETVATAAPPPIYRVDGLTVIPDRMQVIGRDGDSCPLTTADLVLLRAFLDRPGLALSRDRLMDLTGGADWSPLDRTIDNQVARLRKKIERDPSDPKLIRTVRGTGYMFAAEVDRAPSGSSPANSA